MAQTLQPALRRALAERVRYCQEMGIYDFYRRESNRPMDAESDSTPAEAATALFYPALQPETREEMAGRKSAVANNVGEEDILRSSTAWPEHGIADHASALRIIREDLGDCTRCKLHTTRNKIRS